MSKSQRLTTTFLNNLKPNPASAKSTDYEVNLSVMKDSDPHHQFWTLR
ncbi:hypothetical protein [Vibrio harveyi]